jgi:hypothetical protein
MGQLRYPTILTAEEIRNAESYVERGGAVMSKARATRVCQQFKTTPPRHGYEKILEQSEHQKFIIKHESGEYNARVWTSPNAPGLTGYEAAR